MKAVIVVNRHIAAANRKHGVDEPCLSIQTSRGTIYAKTIRCWGFLELIQDAEHPLACGATIWMQSVLETLEIDGRPGQEVLDEKFPLKKSKASETAKTANDAEVLQPQLFSS